MARFDPDGYDDPRFPRDQDVLNEAPPAPPPPDFGVYDGTAGGEEAPPDLGTFEWPSYSGPVSPNIRIGPAPQFKGPRFAAPSYEQAINDPGYRFRADAGSDAIERSAAARGVLRTGGTLKDLAEWNQNFAASEYRNVFDREINAYDRNYRAAYDEFAPRLAHWQAQAGADQASALSSFERAWLQYQMAVQQAIQQENWLRESARPSPQPDVSAN